MKNYDFASSICGVSLLQPFVNHPTALALSSIHDGCHLIVIIITFARSYCECVVIALHDYDQIGMHASMYRYIYIQRTPNACI